MRLEITLRRKSLLFAEQLCVDTLGFADRADVLVQLACLWIAQFCFQEVDQQALIGLVAAATVSSFLAVFQAGRDTDPGQRWHLISLFRHHHCCFKP